MNKTILNFITKYWTIIGGIVSMVIVCTTFFVHTQEVIADYPNMKKQMQDLKYFKDSVNSALNKHNIDLLNLYYYKYPYNSYIHN